MPTTPTASAPATGSTTSTLTFQQLASQVTQGKPPAWWTNGGKAIVFWGTVGLLGTVALTAMLGGKSPAQVYQRPLGVAEPVDELLSVLGDTIQVLHRVVVIVALMLLIYMASSSISRVIRETWDSHDG